MSSSECVFLIALFLIHLRIIIKVIPMTVKLETNVQRSEMSMKCEFDQIFSFLFNDWFQIPKYRKENHFTHKF